MPVDQCASAPREARQRCLQARLRLARRFLPLPLAPDKSMEKLVTQAQQQVAKCGHRLPVVEERPSTINNLFMH